MTIRVTARHAHPVGDLGAVKVLKPQRAEVVRDRSEEEEGVISFAVPNGRRKLVYELPPLPDSESREPRTFTVDIPAGRTRVEFNAAKVEGGTASATRTTDAEASAPTAPSESSDTATEAQAAPPPSEGTAPETGTEPETATAPETAETVGTGQGGAGWQEFAEHVDHEFGKLWGALDEVAYRVTVLENELRDHVINHPTTPSIPTIPTTPTTPTSLEAAAQLAAHVTGIVRDGFLSAADTFASRLGLSTAGGTTSADRSLRQLTLAANAASSAISRYQALPGEIQGSEQFALVSFAAQVRAAGELHAGTVDRVAEAGMRAGDPGEESAYAEVVALLRAAPTGPAIDQLRRFDVGEAGSGTRNRQGVRS
jgi:hypothetical protein